MHSAIRIGLIGDFSDQNRAHQAIPRSLAASGAEGVWVPTRSVTGPQALADFDGIWCVPGMPYLNPDGALRAIRHARMTRTPFLGTSAGFQYAVLEFARNVLGLGEAEHQKSNPKAAMPLISPLACKLGGVKARVRFSEASALRRAYGSRETVEEYNCSFGVNNRYRRLIEGGDMMVAAVDDQDEIRAVEYDGHPFFVATLFQPELRSLTGQEKNPIVNAMVACCERRRQGMTRAAS